MAIYTHHLPAWKREEVESIVENAGKQSRNKAKVPSAVLEEARSRVSSLLRAFPLYPQLDLDFLKDEFLIEEE